MKSVAEIIHEIGHLLPSQGPINVFIHHNTLHSFEELPFDVAIERAAQVYGARPYWRESRYQKEYLSGRITDKDLDDVLARAGDEQQILVPGVSVLSLRRLALIKSPQVNLRAQVEWHLSESRHEGRLSLKHLFQNQEQHRALLARDNAYLRDPGHQSSLSDLKGNVCALLKQLTGTTCKEEISRFEESQSETSPAASELRSQQFLWLICLAEACEYLPGATAEASDAGHSHANGRPGASVSEVVNPYLIKLAASFLDQGLGRWHLAGRAGGFLHCFVTHLKHATVARPWWLSIPNSLSLNELSRASSDSIIESELQRLNIPTKFWHDYLLDAALELRGWGGFMHLFEHRADLSPLNHSSHQHTLSDFIAVKLLLERFATFAHCGDSHKDTATFQLPPLSPQEQDEDRIYSRAFHLLKVSLEAGIGGSDLLTIPKQRRSLLATTLLELSKPKRLKFWHAAYERHFQKRVYRAIVCHQDHRNQLDPETTVATQLVFCIDDREESIRRYFEEFGPSIQTFGAAGFFGIDAEFAAIGKAPAASCPAVITPTHRIQEIAAAGHEGEVCFRARAANLAHRWDDLVGDSSRTPVRGFFVSLGGLAALLPWTLKTFFPQLSVAASKVADTLISEDVTEVEYLTPADQRTVGSISLGYTVEEMVLRVEGILKTIGLIKRIARLVVIVGHGSLSRNNPYKSAYDCGACGGHPGKMNPRVFARMANRTDVREKLKERGIEIPLSTWFLGTFHNTTSDEMKVFDRDLVPKTHASDVERLLHIAQLCRGRNALERTRRFELSHAISEAAAVRHVEARTHHIAEPRPEYGHATNAMCIIGKREFTRGLFLDRRSFLVSYDASIDHESRILENVLGAVVPVCMGINLEYFFSAIDNEVYGAGSKLPQNVAGLIGLMTGNTSDLRTGLPQQMIEIHEPVRLVMIIETSIEKMKALIERSRMLKKVFFNQWIILSVFDSESNTLSTLDPNGEFSTFLVEDSHIIKHPVVGGSLDWAQGLDGPLPFASVQLH